MCLQFVAAQRVLNLRKEFRAHSLVELSFPVFSKTAGIVEIFGLDHSLGART